MEGAARPGHSGAATAVVTKFNIFEPKHAYFGQKDAQQAVVVRQMVRDLAFNVDIVVCPTVREPDGLALSSRNQRLNPDERKAATVLYRALEAARAEWRAGRTEAEHLRATMRGVIEAEPLARLDRQRGPPRHAAQLDGPAIALLSMAVFVEACGTIDNLIVSDDAGSSLIAAPLAGPEG